MKLLPQSIRNVVKEWLYQTAWYRRRAMRRSGLIESSPVEAIEAILNQAPPLRLDREGTSLPRVGIVRGEENLTGTVHPRASWLRYERFCKNNNIPYGFYDITRSDWLQEAEQYDLLICHSAGNPHYLAMFESQLYILDQLKGKCSFPNFHELWQYEEKNRAHFLYTLYNLPTIPTELTFSKKEALALAERAHYPVIAKSATGASSSGVAKINTLREMRRYIYKVFSFKGAPTLYPYQRQKNSLYIQEFIEDATFDLRIIFVGDRAFGYYRYPKKGDFKASGSGLYEKKPIPLDALQLAIKVRDKLQSRQMGVDLLFSEKRNQYFIIETSLFNQIDTPEQLVIDGVPGYYDISNPEKIEFREGRFWVQELMMKDLVTQWIDEQSDRAQQ